MVIILIHNNLLLLQNVLLLLLLLLLLLCLSRPCSSSYYLLSINNYVFMNNLDKRADEVDGKRLQKSPQKTKTLGKNFVAYEQPSWPWKN